MGAVVSAALELLLALDVAMDEELELDELTEARDDEAGVSVVESVLAVPDQLPTASPALTE